MYQDARICMVVHLEAMDFPRLGNLIKGGQKVRSRKERD